MFTVQEQMMKFGRVAAAIVGIFMALAFAGSPASAADKQPNREELAPISVLDGTVIKLLNWQSCASNGFPVIVLSIDTTPNVHFGDCDNAGIHITQDEIKGAITILDDTAITVGAWQACGSTLVGGVGLSISLGAPNVQFGNCNNSEIVID